MKTVDLIYFNAGGGHRASAMALQQAIHERKLPWRVRAQNLFDILDPHDVFRRVTRMRPEDWYNKRLAHGWTIGLTQELKLLQRTVRLGHPALVRLLRQHWLRTEPDMVVSVIPNFNRCLYESVAGALPGVPFVTVMTDLADLPPNFWLEAGQRQDIICGTARAVEQARSLGYPDERIHATSGMILRPDFYRQAPMDRAQEMRRHGLDPNRRTALVLFGGHGSRSMLGIARRLPNTQLILMCGHNKALADRLRALPGNAPRLVVGFTSDIPYYMRLADFFIGKPGPGSISEAISQGLPVIVVNNRWTMPQERYNPQWVRENGVGIAHDSFLTIDAAVDRMLRRLSGYRANVRAVDNRALFEIPDILCGIMQAAQRPRAVDLRNTLPVAHSLA